MIHEIIAVGPLQCNCSIIGDETSREAIVIDPGADIDDILAILARHRLTVKQIFITHGHIDHIGGAAKLRKATDAPVLMNAADEMQVRMLDMQAQWIGMPLPGQIGIDRHVKDMDRVKIEGFAATVLHTPGHTEGSSCLYFPEHQKLIAGDTLFAGSIGRTDLPGGDFNKIMHSLHGTLMELPEEAVVIPGHGPQTTIGEERSTNPFITDHRYKPRVAED